MAQFIDLWTMFMCNHLPLPTLKRKKMMSPSSTTYSLPFCTYFPSAFTFCSSPKATKSSYFMISAQMKPFSKSVWITPAAWGALVSFLMVQQRTSSAPAVKQQMRSRALYPALMILGSMLRFFSSLFSSSLRSCSALQGMISPGTCSSIHSLIFFSHLFFLVAKSYSLRLIRQTTDLAVMSLWPLRTAISALLQSPWRTHLFFWRMSRTFTRTSFSSRASLGLVRLISFSTSSRRLLIYSRSLRTSSLLMISISRIGSTEFSVWVISSSSKARTTWQIPSVSLMLLKKWFPRPSPCDAPLTMPAISTICSTAATSDLGWYMSQSLRKRSSGTGTTALLGSMVQKGQFQAGTLRLESRLQVVDLPTLGSPTIPIRRVLPGRPHRIFWSYFQSFFLGGIDVVRNIGLSKYFQRTNKVEGCRQIPVIQGKIAEIQMKQGHIGVWVALVQYRAQLLHSNSAIHIEKWPCVSCFPVAYNILSNHIQQMIKKILATGLSFPSTYHIPSRLPSLLTHSTYMRFSSQKGDIPRNKQEAWMMQQQKNLKTAPVQDEMQGKTYEGVTKLGVGGLILLTSALAYFYYSASQRGKENLDTIEEDITGFKELKHKERAIGGDWTLTNADGLPFSSRNLTGSYYLIYFGYTNCPDICPSSLYYLSSVYRIIRNLPEGAYMKLKLVFVSVDPERDSPKVIKSYLTEFGKNIIGVTGTSEDDIQLKECLRKFKIKASRVYYKEGPKKGSYEIDHTTRVYLMDPDNYYLDHLDPTLTEQQTAKAIVAKIVQHEHKKEKAEQRMATPAAAPS